MSPSKVGFSSLASFCKPSTNFVLFAMAFSNVAILLALPTYIGVTTFGNITKSLIGRNGAFDIDPPYSFLLKTSRKQVI